MIYTDNYECLDIPAVLRKYNPGICEEMHRELDEYEDYLNIPTFMRRNAGEVAYDRGGHEAESDTIGDEGEAANDSVYLSFAGGSQKYTSEIDRIEADDHTHVFEVLSYRCSEGGGLQIMQIADLYDLGLSDDTCNRLKMFVDLSSGITEQSVSLVYLSLLVDFYDDLEVKLALRGGLLGLNLSENILAQLNNCLSKKFRSAQWS